MKILLSEIFDFYALRLKSHVASVNYFADLFGFHFPEHDGDKVKEPLRTGYAYIVYNNYHKNFWISLQQMELCLDSQKMHHEHAPHHLQFYTDVSQIPDLRIYEMISDWASANFEQKNIICDKNAISLRQWFDKNKSGVSWNKHQLEIINDGIAKISEKTDEKILKNIWKSVLEKSDL